ncbi:MAG TPA: glycosyltransferase family 39 protein [Bryobacteraceae bacterium]|nr:glycosyltransferase family 39 protein [Bryobacteraceae bacterium]
MQTAVKPTGPDVTNAGPAHARLLNLLLSCILTLIVIRLWLMPLPSSFWIDEMATVFVVHIGAQDASLRVAPQVAQSIYYVLPGIVDRFVGESEVAYRIPSVLAMAATLWFVFRLAVRFIHPEAGWFAVFACLSLRGINYQAADARPYALGTCIAAGSLVLLIRWLDSGRFWDGLWFVAAASLLWRVHLVYWPFYGVYVAYTIARVVGAETKVGRRQAVLIFALLGTSLLPTAVTALALNRQASAHVIGPVPSFEDLANGVKLGLIAGSCMLAVLVARWFRWPQNPESVSGSALLLILCWWLIQPLCLFSFSWITANSVFVPRYLFIALPGAALMATAIAAPFLPPVQWKRVSVGLGVGILLFLGQWGRLWPVHEQSGWKAAAGRIQELGLGPGEPVICPSPFIEARPPVWRPDYPLPGFLYAHLSVYPVRGKIYPFPFEASLEAEKYAARLSRETLAGSRRFVIYGGDHSVWYWREWFAVRAELSGWRRRQLGPFGDVDVVLYERN